MPRVNDPEPVLVNQEDEEKILILPLAKKDSFLLEVNQNVKKEIDAKLQKIQEKLEVVKKGKDKGKGKMNEENSTEKKELIPYIDCSSLNVSK